MNHSSYSQRSEEPRPGLLRFAAAALDLLFPPRCQACLAFRPQPLCDECRSTFQLIAPPFCDQCGEPLPGSQAGTKCAACRRDQFYFIAARSAARFEGRLRSAIHAFKYDGRTHLAGPLGALMAECLLDPVRGLPIATIELVVPIPLHLQRQRQRGYNQSELLGREVAQRVGRTLDAHCCRRTRPTVDQIGLSARQREDNVRGAFTAEGDALRGRVVLLIDDMYTTGATMNECARALRRAGAADVYGLTLARAVW